MRQAVVGVGSPFAGDGVGWWVVDHLQERLEPGEVDLIKVDRPGVALLEVMLGYQQVVLVDAVATNRGEAISVIDKAELVALSSNMETAESLSTHAVGVAGAVALGEALGQLPQRLACVGVPLALTETALSEELLNEVLDKAAERVLEQLEGVF